MTGPVYRRKALPEFFRGMSLSSIDKMLKEYYIPTCGPGGKFYEHATLVEFVAEPEKFKIAKGRKVTPKAATVEDVLARRKA